jgi:hypothetical protein
MNRAMAWAARAVVGACLLFGGGGARAEQVLGADAAGPVKAWAGALRGLTVRGIGIAKGGVTIDVGKGCSLVLSLPADAKCSRARSVGNGIACWEGDACPPEAAREEAISAAGHLSLPWIDLSSGGPAPGARDPIVERARGELTAALASGDRAGARAALRSLLTANKGVRPPEWPSLLPLAPPLGLGAEAAQVAQRPELAELGWTTLTVTRVAVLRGPAMAAAVGAAILDAETACGLVAIARAWLVEAPVPAVALARAVQTATPTCFEAWAVQVDGHNALGQPASAQAVALAARDQFGKDPRLDGLSDAHLAVPERLDDLKEKLELRLAEGDRSDAVLLRLAALYNLAEERTERATDLARQIKERPDDMVFRFFAGVVLLGDRDFARALDAFQGTEKAFPTLAEIPMSVALASFNLGDVGAARKAIARAAKAAPRHAEIALAEAEILRDVDRPRALMAIARHLALLDGTRVLDGPERERAEAISAALSACAAAKAKVCEGPWLHFPDALARDRLAKETEKANEELRARQAEMPAPLGPAPGAPDAATP